MARTAPRPHPDAVLSPWHLWPGIVLLGLAVATAAAHCEDLQAPPRTSAVRSAVPVPSSPPSPSSVTVDQAPPPLLPPGANVIAQARGVAPIQTALRTGDILREQQVPGWSLDIKPHGRALLRRLKDAALTVIEGRLGQLLPGLGSAEPAEVTRALCEPFVLAGARCGPLTEDAELGALALSLKPLLDHRDRWAVVLDLRIPCGTDSVLAIFERREGQLRLVLTVRSDDYVSIRDAPQGMVFAASPPDAQDRYYIVAASSNPWCSPSFYGIKYVAVAPSKVPARPELLVEEHEWAEAGTPFVVTATAGGFTVDFRLGISGGGGPHGTPVRHEYRRVPKGFERVDAAGAATP